MTSGRDDSFDSRHLAKLLYTGFGDLLLFYVVIGCQNIDPGSLIGFVEIVFQNIQIPLFEGGQYQQRQANGCDDQNDQAGGNSIVFQFAPGQLPASLNSISFFSAEEANRSAVKRSLTLEMEGAENPTLIGTHDMFTIGGEAMNMSVINHRVRRGDLEQWTITAEMMPHPFHIHGVSFQVLSQGGKPPSDADRGWKDTVVVSEQPTVLLMRFNHVATANFPYMYHCHILEHEDFGMMGQFTVQ